MNVLSVWVRPLHLFRGVRRSALFRVFRSLRLFRVRVEALTPLRLFRGVRHECPVWGVSPYFCTGGSGMCAVQGVGPLRVFGGTGMYVYVCPVQGARPLHGVFS